MKKHSISIFILCLLPVSAIALALYCLETYYEVVHNESSLLVCGYSIIAFVVSTVLFIRIKKEKYYSIGIWIFSIVVLAFVFYVGYKIPFCVECDRVTAEDLGFLIHWIKPITPPQ